VPVVVIVVLAERAVASRLVVVERDVAGNPSVASTVATSMAEFPVVVGTVAEERLVGASPVAALGCRPAFDSATIEMVGRPARRTTPALAERLAAVVPVAVVLVVGLRAAAGMAAAGMAAAGMAAVVTVAAVPVAVVLVVGLRASAGMAAVVPVAAVRVAAVTAAVVPEVGLRAAAGMAVGKPVAVETAVAALAVAGTAVAELPAAGSNWVVAERADLELAAAVAESADLELAAAVAAAKQEHLAVFGWMDTAAVPPYQAAGATRVRPAALGLLVRAKPVAAVEAALGASSLAAAVPEVSQAEGTLRQAAEFS
jgi:hypothetical protein